ncbi:MAG: hypothetical protein HY300_16880 [Verrucomicrobia bacterium]|nr:hypothetical protein [Verrucomicrobiota bacterium]
MIPKYHIEYTVHFGRHTQASHFQTDDPVACLEFLVEALERGFKLRGIHHEGVELNRHDFDKLVKTAAGLFAARRVCAALDIKPEEEHFRFGFAA